MAIDSAIFGPIPEISASASTDAAMTAQGAEPGGQDLRGRRAEVLDAERGEEPGQRSVP